MSRRLDHQFWSDPDDRADRLDFIRFRDQYRKELWWVALILAIVAGIVWVGTSERALGMPRYDTFVAATPAPEHSGHNSIWLAEGATGDQVTEIQTILAGHGWTIAIDGQYGPQTGGVVARFQESSNLLADGIVGPVTWRALQSVAPATRLNNAIQLGTPDVPLGTPDVPLGAPGDCDTWRPRIEAGPIPWDWAKKIAKRESGCWDTNWVHAQDNDDHSHGGFQVNILNRNMREWLATYGYTHDVLHTTEGAIQAAEAMYEKCGKVPWTPPYQPGCGGELRRFEP